jgi:hypothetical protein
MLRRRPALRGLRAARRHDDAHPSVAEALQPRWTVDVDALSSTAWDEVVAGFADASYEQTACWVDHRWGAGRASHLVVRRDGVPVGAARALILQWPGIRRGIAYVKFGPLWRRHDEPPDPDAYRRCVEALVDEYCTRRGHCLTVLPRVSPEHHAGEGAALRALGFAVRRPMLDPNRYLVDATSMRSGCAASDKWR